MGFKVGDKVKIVPTEKRWFNGAGLMEVTVGKIGTITKQDPDWGNHVEFKDKDVLDDIKKLDVPGRTGWWYHDCDIIKQPSFKGN